MRNHITALVLALMSAAGCSAPGLPHDTEPGDRARAAQFSSVEEKKAPYFGVMNYPENWPEISELRGRHGGR